MNPAELEYLCLEELPDNCFLVIKPVAEPDHQCDDHCQTHQLFPNGVDERLPGKATSESFGTPLKRATQHQHNGKHHHQG